MIASAAQFRDPNIYYGNSDSTYANTEQAREYVGGCTYAVSSSTGDDYSNSCCYIPYHRRLVMPPPNCMAPVIFKRIYRSANYVAPKRFKIFQPCWSARRWKSKT